MAITVYGVPTSIDVTGWSRLMRRVQQARGAEMFVPTGLKVTTTGTAFQVAVPAGEAVMAGALAVNDATVNLTLPSSGTAPRIDVIAMQVNWTGTTTTAGTIVRVAGSAATSPSAPGVTKNPGVLWQTPLANVRVNTNGSIVVTDVRPSSPDTERTCSGTVQLSDGGTLPSSATVAFPADFFTAAPRVVMTPVNGAQPTTTSNFNASAITAASFTANLNRTSTTTVTFNWIASGV